MPSEGSDIVFDEIELIEKTYAATLEPEHLTAFEECWEAYLDSYLSSSTMKIGKAQIDTHIMLALDILKRVDHSDKSKLSAQKIVDEQSGFRVVVDDVGDIVAVNDQAKTMTQDCISLWDLGLDREGRSKIEGWIKGRRNSNSDKHLFVHLHLGNLTRKSCFFLTPIRLEHSANENREYYLVSRVDSEIDLSVTPFMQSTYGLSSAEADVAIRLASGMSPKEVADDRNASIHTVRTQVKKLLVKTDTKNIQDMVRVISGFSARLENLNSQAKKAGPQATEAEGILRAGGMTLSSGRFFEFLEQGHPAGYPVIFLHSLITDVGLTHSAAKEAVVNGLRFITPIRAGYGNSAPNPQKNVEAMVDCAANDLKALFDHLSIKKAVLVCGWSGCFAQRFALKFPKLASGLLHIRSVPLWESNYLRTFRPRYRNIVKSSIYLPRAVPYLARVGKVLMDTGREHIFAAGMNRERPVDLLALEEPDILDTVARSYHYISKQGVETFSEELRTIHTDWVDDARKMKVPVTVIVEDEYLDFPKHAFDRYLDIVPHAKLVNVQGAGEYLYMTHFQSVLSEIKNFRSQTQRL